MLRFHFSLLAMLAGEICGEGAVPDGVSLPGYDDADEELPISFSVTFSFYCYW